MYKNSAVNRWKIRTSSAAEVSSLNLWKNYLVIIISKMKFALIFLMAFVALSQQFYLQRPNVPMVWLSPHPARHLFNNYRPIVVFNEDLNRDSEDSQNNTDGEQDGYPDVQSRTKSNRPSLFNNQQPQSGRFLAGNFGNPPGYNYNGYQNNNNNPFLRTYTTTTTSTTTTISLSTSTSTSISTSLTTSTSTVVIPNTATLSLTSVVRCVPAFQLSAAGATSCGRKKRGIDDIEDSDQHRHFVISPSETFKLMPTALPSETRELALPAEQLKSSKDEVIHNVEVSTLDKQREKRFLLNNRNYYTTSTVTATSTSVITIPTTTVSQSISTLTSFTSTTSTTFVFSNSTVTNTVNLIFPVPTVQCAAAAAAGPPVVAQCVACLPVGYVVCAASGG